MPKDLPPSLEDNNKEKEIPTKKKPAGADFMDITPAKKEDRVIEDPKLKQARIDKIKESLKEIYPKE